MQVLAELGQSKAVAFDQIDKVSCTACNVYSIPYMCPSRLLHIKDVFTKGDVPGAGSGGEGARHHHRHCTWYVILPNTRAGACAVSRMRMEQHACKPATGPH